MLLFVLHEQESFIRPVNDNMGSSNSTAAAAAYFPYTQNSALQKQAGLQAYRSACGFYVELVDC